MDKIIVTRKVSVKLKLIETSWMLSCTTTETVCSSKIVKSIGTWKNIKSFWQNKNIYRNTSTSFSSFSSGPTNWMKRQLIDKKIIRKTGCSVPSEQFLILLRTENVFSTHKCSQNLLQGASYCWNDRIFSNDMDQSFHFRGVIGSGNSYLDILFC